MTKDKKGDSLYLTEVPDGFRPTPNDSNFERQMQLVEDIMHDDREILKALSQ